MNDDQTSADHHSGTDPTLSPTWAPGTKRLIQGALIILSFLILYRVRGVLLPIIISMFVAYALEPFVRFLEGKTTLRRNAAIALVYLALIAILIAIPVGTIPRIINQVNLFIENLPNYILAIGEFLSRPVVIREVEIPLDELQLEEIYRSLSANLIDILRSIGSQSFTLFGGLASATLSTVAWIIVILFISFYMVKDHRMLMASAINLLPEAHHPEINRLAQEINDLWNAFFRGRLLLCGVIGVITFVLATIIGLPNALALAIIAGIGEFVPNVGPTLASIPAMLVAAFQHQASWLGAITGPFWFVLIVLGLYIMVQQVENTFLVPRVIGRQLNMHPMLVFIAALAGASVAGVLGILLAAPSLATSRLIIIYIYRKLNDLPPFPDMRTEESATREQT